MRKIIPLLLLTGSTVMAVMIFVQQSPEKMIISGQTANLISPKVNGDAPAIEPIPDLPTQAVSATAQNIGIGIAEEIFAQNPEGPEISDEGSLITAPNPQKIAEQIIKERLSQSSFALITPEVDISALKIIPNNDPVFIDGYLQNTKAISDKNFSGINIDFNDPDIEEFKKLADAYDKTIKEYYTLNVPSSLLDLHKEKLTLFMRQKKIFTNIANIEKDPLAALVSMRLIGEAYNDLTNLNERIVQFAKKYDL